MRTIKKQLKRAFTIVELVIVIAVVAALAAILIPTFVNVVNSANESVDTSLVKNLNTILTSEEILNGGQASTMKEALSRVNDNGYSVDKLTPTSTGDIIWDQEEDQFLLVNNGTVVYPADTTLDSNVYRYWYIVEKEEDLNTTSYSQYLAYDVSGTTVTSTNGASIDVGENTNVTLTVNTSNSQISAGGAVAVSAKRTVAESASLSTPDYRINANGTKTTMVISGNVTLYGTVSGNIVLTSGKLTIAAGASVSAIYVDASKSSDVSITNNSSNVIEVAAETLTVTDLINGDSSLKAVTENKYNENFGGFGTENSPYIISTAEEFKNITSGTSSSINYYALAADIHFDNDDFSSNTCYAIIKGYSHYIDLNGNGYSLSAEVDELNAEQGGSNFCYIFEYTYGIITLHDFDVVINSFDTYFSLIRYSGYYDTDVITFENIDAVSTETGAVVSGDLYNNGIYTTFGYGGTLNFINCDNYVDHSGTVANRYYAIYIGGYYLDNITTNFTNCDNYGDLTAAGYVAMFVGNSNNGDAYTLTFTITNCYNYGVIKGGLGASLFAINGTSTTYSTLNSKYLTICNKGEIGLTSFSNFYYTVNADGTITYDLSSCSTASNVGYVVLSLTASIGNYYSDGTSAGSGAVTITETISTETLTSTYTTGKFVTLAAFENLGGTISEANYCATSSSVKVYREVLDDAVYYVCVYESESGSYISVNADASIYLVAYTSGGAILGQAELKD